MHGYGARLFGSVEGAASTDAGQRRAHFERGCVASQDFGIGARQPVVEGGVGSMHFYFEEYGVSSMPVT